MNTYLILCLVLLAINLLQLIVFCFVNNKYTKLLKTLNEREVDDVNIKKHVRYTEKQTVVDENGEMMVSLSQKDILLAPKVTQVVSKKGEIKPGKYTLLATKDKNETFNIRIDTYVQEYHHNQDIVLAEGQEITAVNTSVILR